MGCISLVFILSYHVCSISRRALQQVLGNLFGARPVEYGTSFVQRTNEFPIHCTFLCSKKDLFFTQYKDGVILKKKHEELCSLHKNKKKKMDGRIEKGCYRYNE